MHQKEDRGRGFSPQKKKNSYGGGTLSPGVGPLTEAGATEEYSLPEMRAMPITLGGSLPLEDIIGRDEVVESLWKDLASNSLIMNATRRFGKTSTMRLVEARTPEGWICVRGTVQNVATTAELTGLTLNMLHEHAGVGLKIKRFIEKIIKIPKSASAGFAGAQLSVEFREGNEGMIQLRSALSHIGAQLKQEEQRLVIIWDEFPDAVRSIQSREGDDAAVAVMSFFRALREMQGGEQIRWILTGSVGFHHVLRAIRGRSSWINDMLPVGLDPLSDAWSCWMARRLLTGIGRGTEGAEVLADIAGGIPFMLELLVKYLLEEKKPAPETAEEALDLLREMAVSGGLGDNWEPLLERVEDYYGDDRMMAETMLDIYAEGPISKTAMEEKLKSRCAGRQIESPPPQRVDDILDLLVRDHYLKYEVKSGTHRWRYEPLRVVWHTRRWLHVEGEVKSCL